MYQRYMCKACGSWFNDKTGTLFFNSKLSLRRWFFAALLMDLNAPTTRISEVLRVTYKTALRITKGLRRSIYLEDVVERLKGVVEVDETYLKVGLKEAGAEEASTPQSLEAENPGNLLEGRAAHPGPGAAESQEDTSGAHLGHGLREAVEEAG